MITNLISTYFDNINYQQPIFMNDIYKYIKNKVEVENEMSINTCVARYVNNNPDIKRFRKGIYYKTKNTPFGAVPIDYKALVSRLYLNDGGIIIGYIDYKILAQKLGLTTQLCKKNYYVTNNNRSLLIDETIELKKPVIEVNNDNYMYLEVLDLIENKDGIPYDCDIPEDIIYKYIVDNNLSFEKLLHYALYYKNSNSLLLKLAKLAR